MSRRSSSLSVRATVFSVVIAFLVFAQCATVVSAPARTIRFGRDVRPILSDYCFTCHGPDANARKAELRLDTKAGLFTVRGDVAPFVPGEPEASEAIRRVCADSNKERMPPPSTKRTLTTAQREILREWVRQGAHWEGHWAFEAPRRPAVPRVGGASGSHNPVDAFVLARLEREGLAPNPAASRRELLRRVTFDLTGLPPTPGELEAFDADRSAGAFERVVDRLLASPRYGERMAWDWLEAARYADTNGYQGDQTRTMWPYRDWVVNALNRNMPYDDFVVWQLAGDLLPEASFEQRLATAFCRNHMINGEGGRIAEENRVEYVFDQIEAVGTIWLGLTVTCARCHDHKYDPLTQREYYGLFAHFNQTPVTGAGGNPQTPPTLTVRTAADTAELAARRREVEALEQELAERGRRLRSAEGRAAWEASVRDAGASWAVLQPTTARSVAGQTMEIRDDRAILVSGKNPVTDTYTVELHLPAGRHTAIRLEALRHASMTAGGLARSNSGNFVLTEIECALRGTERRLEIASAEATFEQGDLKVRNAFDGQKRTGWAVYQGRPIRRNHAAVFRFAAPIDVEDAATLVVTLRHESRHARHNLGHFRLATTAARDPHLGVSAGDPDGELAAALRAKPGERSKAQEEILAAAWLRTDVAYRELAKRRDAAQARWTAFRKGTGRVKVMVMADRAEKRKTYRLERGIYSQRGEEVEAVLPAFLPGSKPRKVGDRLTLARWLVGREHPLTARVTVNRHWQKFFGTGLVKTVDDFGAQGSKPSHPELLDWLATEFVRSGWDVKALHRLLVTTAVYRQSARVSQALLERDPENRLLARGPRFRLPSWMIRDAALAAGGLLVEKRGGPPVKPYQPAGVWADATFGKQRYKADRGDKLYRRSLYTFWRRIIGPPVFFDAAKRQTCSVAANRTNTPLHALTTLNDVTYVEAARVMAQRVLRARAASDDRIALAFELATSRRPHAEEVDVLARRLVSLQDHYSARPDAARDLLAVGESPNDPSLEPAEHAAWTNLCSLVLNLDEALNR